ncbi:hypothetical protein OE88DRAFT_1358568 [Heliocybe sulcata]|uniref:Ubiquitin-like domain-containing protein n=1 Tax=Heliocybe sulcata TaxID=5364 RepID=A0A5C3N606_9AGAM|nr:hypothetical protein OE88DRAFT_1358568 [Heliocybe sulcata]
MVFPVTCSSVGDIIAVASLALKIAQILSHSTGASYEYQCLIEELRLLGQTLQHTHAVGQLLPLNVDVMNSLRSQVAQCKDLMDKFMARIEGYRKRLGGDVSGFSATWRKIGWGLFKTEEVTDLRSKLSTHRTMLVLFLTIGNTTGISSLIDYASEARQHHQSIQIKLAEIYTALRQLPPTIGHSLANSIYFVDALGSRMMLPIQLVSSWDKFETILKFHFQDRVGRWHVERDQYVIISDTGSGVIDSATWADSIKAVSTLRPIEL